MMKLDDFFAFFFSSRRRHTRCYRDWSSDVCSSDLPPEFIEELATLQDSVPPLTQEEVVQVMEEELGVPWEDVFESIAPEPMAAGTIAEVHRAVLATGERAVVKVQRPTAREDIMRDLGLLKVFAEKTADRPGFRQ